MLHAAKLAEDVAYFDFGDSVWPLAKEELALEFQVVLGYASDQSIPQDGGRSARFSRCNVRQKRDPIAMRTWSRCSSPLSLRAGLRLLVWLSMPVSKDGRR